MGMDIVNTSTSEISPTGNATTPSTFLIVGLGNPGRKYYENRHNIGFRVLDQLAARLGTNFSRLESKALVTKVDYQGKRLVMAKPQTYMNLSGVAVSTLVRFYQIPLEQMLIVFDDVDLMFGTLRLRASGGSGGQKGVQSIIERLGTDQFPRLRVGIDRPPGRMDAASYVLQNFSRSENEALGSILDRAVEAIQVFVTQGLASAMNQYNGQAT